MNAHTAAERSKRADRADETGVSFLKETAPRAGFCNFQASIW
jgi:hypothetical protein